MSGVHWENAGGAWCESSADTIVTTRDEAAVSCSECVAFLDRCNRGPLAPRSQQRESIATIDWMGEGE